MMGNYHVRFDRGLRGKVSQDNSPLCLPNSRAGQASCKKLSQKGDRGRKNAGMFESSQHQIGVWPLGNLQRTVIITRHFLKQSGGIVILRNERSEVQTARRAQADIDKDGVRHCAMHAMVVNATAQPATILNCVHRVVARSPHHAKLRKRRKRSKQ